MKLYECCFCRTHHIMSRNSTLLVTYAAEVRQKNASFVQATRMHGTTDIEPPQSSELHVSKGGPYT